MPRMNPLTVWLLVIMGATGELKVIDKLPSQAACVARLAAAAPDLGAFCVAASLPRR